MLVTRGLRWAGVAALGGLSGGLVTSCENETSIGERGAAAGGQAEFSSMAAGAADVGQSPAVSAGRGQTAMGGGGAGTFQAPGGPTDVPVAGGGAIASGGGHGVEPNHCYPGQGFIVHEWGTDTIVVGSDGSLQRGLHHEEEDLPPFVYDRIEAGTSIGAGASPSVTIKMETPVTYFYSPAPLLVNARVEFPKGVLTQWYPGVTTFLPPVAAAGSITYPALPCTLLYLAAGSDPGALHLRNLATGEDSVLETSATKPRRPAVSGPVITWEADGVQGSEVRVRFDGKVESMSGPFVRAEEPRATADAVVFTAFLGPGPNDDSDVYLFDVESRQLSVIAAGAGQQRFADVSATHVAVTDFSEDPKGYFDEAGSISDIALIERATGLRSDRVAPGKQAFPLLGTDGVFAYLEWAAVHPEPKLGQFWLKVGYLDRPISEDFNVKVTGQVSTNPAYVRPSLRGLNLDFIDQGADGTALYRAAVSTPGTLASVKIAGAQQLFGPVAGDRFTLLASQRSAQNYSLLAVAR